MRPGSPALSASPPKPCCCPRQPNSPTALWIAEEAARLSALGGGLLEVDGNPDRLDLTATRRLHRRAQAAGRPVLLLRQSALAEPTAAPVRLLVAPAPAAPRHTLAGPLAEVDRPAGLHRRHRQEPHGPAGHVHSGVEPP